MSLNFSAREIFEMGIQIEVNGKTFYETAAKKTAETSVRDFFKELAVWENQHVALFTEMRDSLRASAGAADIFDPDGEAEAYIRATGDSHVFIRNKDVGALVAGCKSPVEILDLALTFEKDSVVFYTTMKKVVAANLGQAKVDRLIDEEIKHISLLTQRQAKLKART